MFSTRRQGTLVGIKRVVNLSSEETYGVFESDRIDETHPNRPLKPYGISKYAVERLACDYASAYGLEIIHVRTCWVYGPGLPRPRVPKILIDAAVAGRKLHLPSGGDFRVDHVYIDDCVDGIEAVRKGALDITRARTELGYEPRFPIKKGLAAYLEATRAGRA